MRGNPIHSASLRSRLTWLIIAVLVAVLIPLGVLSYQRELREMNALLDGRLAQAGRTIGTLIEHGDIATPQGSATVVPKPVQDAAVVNVRQRNFEPEVGFQAYNQRMQPMVATVNLADLPAPTASEHGFRNIERKGERWRIFTLRNRAGLTIRIGERYTSRKSIAQGLILEHSLPLLIGLPLLAVLASWAVRRGLRPLDLLTRQLAERTPGSRQPIAAEGTPREIKPLLGSLNQQLERLEDAIERERRFNADVAHELRTPLAATMIHLESAAIANNSDDAEFALKNAQQSLTRLARRIEQILVMAQLETGAAANERASLDLVALATEVIEELAPLIAEKDIALGLVHASPQLQVPGHEAAMTAMFRNLIENALRYVEIGGQVEVALSQGWHKAVIEISDDGPGIPAEQREQMFDRFRRGERASAHGYGLGLNIVRRAAQLHDAQIDLLDSPFGHGLQVRVTLPLVPETSQGSQRL